jgi:hypothetical protein
MPPDFKSKGLEGTDVILAGCTWTIADLAPRQWRKVIPLVMQLKGVSLTTADEATFNLILDALYWSLQRNYPELGREVFLDLPIKFAEVLAAVPALMAACALDEAVERLPGEAPGAAAPSTTSSMH